MVGHISQAMRLIEELDRTGTEQFMPCGVGQVSVKALLASGGYLVRYWSGHTGKPNNGKWFQHRRPATDEVYDYLLFASEWGLLF